MTKKSPVLRLEDLKAMKLIEKIDNRKLIQEPTATLVVPKQSKAETVPKN